MKTGAELKARREELKITQQDLADEIGVSRTQLSRMESGKIEIPIEIRPILYDLLYAKQEVKSELTINDIQVGDELECVDLDKMGCIGYAKQFIDYVSKNPTINIHSINTQMMLVNIGDGSFYIEECDLKYFRKKPKLQFSDLEVGDYVYVRDDLVDYLKYGTCYFLERGMDKGLQRIDDIEGNIITLQNKRNYPYSIEMIDLSRSMKKEDYLKMGEKEIASFEELQYVANKALDESIIEKYEVCIGHYGNKNMIIHFDGKFTEYSDNSTNSGIEFIQSLYTEEFVIETMADELRIKSGAELTLSNGINCVYFDDGDRKLRYDGDFYPCNFLVLKGATVKQSKGVK